MGGLRGCTGFGVDYGGVLDQQRVYSIVHRLRVCTVCGIKIKVV